MAVAVTINSVVASDPGSGIDFTQNTELVSGMLTLSGNYGNHSPANGDTLDFTGQDKIKSQQIPLWVRIFQYPISPNAPVAYSFLYAHGTTQANGVLIVHKRQTEFVTNYWLVVAMVTSNELVGIF